AVSEVFASWRRTLVEERAKSADVTLAGDQPIHLDPPLRPSLWQIRFSPDGAHILVQDDSKIYIVNRSTFRVELNIDAPDAFAAKFTPDGHSIVVDDANLRIEQWSVDSGKRTSVKELVVYDGCTQTLLSRDGRTLVCAGLFYHDGEPRVSLRLIDVESGKPFYDKPKFFDPALSQSNFVYGLAMETLLGARIASMITSPDGRFLIVAVFNQVLAYDLDHRQQIVLGGKLHDIQQQRMSFLGPDKLYVIGDSKGKGLFDARLYSFPDGRLLNDSYIGDQQVEAVTHGDYLIASPVKSYASVVWDPVATKIVATSKLAAIDVYDKAYATEDTAGGLLLGRFDSPNVTHIPLPLSPLPALRAASLSWDGKYLAISTRDRGQLWNLADGKQIALIRPFGSASFDDKDQLFAQFTKYLDKEGFDSKVQLNPIKVTELSKLDTAWWQQGDLELHFKPLGRDKDTNHHATLEVRKMGSATDAWTHDYQHEMPACWPADGGRLLLAWDIATPGFHDELKIFPQLEPELTALKGKKKGLLLEAVNRETGAPEAQVIVPEADLSNGRNDERHAIISGNYVIARGEHDNTVIYRFKDASKIGEFFGHPMAVNSDSGLIAATNREDEVILVKEETGRELARFSFTSPVRLAQIQPPTQPGKTGRLLILTADQVLHQLPLPAQP
ncbi:MAG TPA: WD40 repeat domain-containing protein, partial [Acidobacteriaceae bacterium]|nr:WD40 repeat domain-containing protein [Acidobacteriaceae bacterium]